MKKLGKEHHMEDQYILLSILFSTQVNEFPVINIALKKLGTTQQRDSSDKPTGVLQVTWHMWSWDTPWKSLPWEVRHDIWSQGTELTLYLQGHPSTEWPWANDLISPIHKIDVRWNWCLPGGVEVLLPSAFQWSTSLIGPKTSISVESPSLTCCIKSAETHPHPTWICVQILL